MKSLFFFSPALRIYLSRVQGNIKGNGFSLKYRKMNHGRQ